MVKGWWVGVGGSVVGGFNKALLNMTSTEKPVRQELVLHVL